MRHTLFGFLLQNAAPNRTRSFLTAFGHWGALGLFALAILDSLPLPTLGGPDILLAILVGRRQTPWYEGAAVATVGSLIGAILSFRMAKGAGKEYVEKKFGQGKAYRLLTMFERSGTGVLVASTAIPFPFPTSLVFAAAGASGYSWGKFLALVTVCRIVRYSSIAWVADRFGPRFLRVFRHPVEYWGWFLLMTAVVAGMIWAGFFVGRRLERQQPSFTD